MNVASVGPGSQFAGRGPHYSIAVSEYTIKYTKNPEIEERQPTAIDRDKGRDTVNGKENSSSSAAARKLRRGIVCAQYSVIIVITAGPILAADDYPLTKLRGRKEINRKLKVICQFSNGTMD